MGEQKMVIAIEITNKCREIQNINGKKVLGINGWD